MSVEDLKTALADYMDILTFEEVGEIIKIIQKSYIPTHKWEAIYAIVKEWNGHYVGGIKERHWTVPRKQETPQRPSKQEVEFVEREDVKQKLLWQAVDLLEQARQKLREAGY